MTLRVRARLAALTAATVLLLLVLTTTSANENTHYLPPLECVDPYGRPQRCIPEFENAAYQLQVEATNTCGDETDTDFCVQTGYSNRKSCDVCHAGQHSPQFLTDFHDPNNPTWWQSETMFEGVQYPNQVNLTLGLGKSFDITYIRIVFHSPRPESFAIYKRVTPNGPWIPYQYYSATCRDTYGLPDSLSVMNGEDESRALCTSEYSDISPLRDGNIAFSSLEGRPSAINFDHHLELQQWVTATDIRITLDRLNTFGDEVFGDAQVLKSYFYAIADIAVGARCKCNGHASECTTSTALDGQRTRVCKCMHFTDGPDCDRCLPFYNDAPWGRATSKNVHECKQNCNIATNGSTSSNASSYHSAHQNHQQNHQFNNYHNAFQHQSSVTSVSSVQTVLNQSLQNSTNINRLIENVCQNGNNFNLNTFGSCSSLITTNGHVSSNGSTIRDNMNSGVSVSSAEEPLSVGDVADLLHPQYAIITGGRSKDGCPLITFPDYNNFQNLTDLEYQKLMLYLTSVPSLSEADLGFNLIIDRRKDRWAAVKAVLLKISIYFPAIVHFVFVIRPAGFLQKAISEVSNKFFKDEFRFRVIVCATLEELYDYVCRSQLTIELGGELAYSHHDWIQQRISLEKFSGLTNIISSNLDAFMKSIHDMEFPNSVEATEKLIHDQGEQYEKLKEDILSAGQHGEVLLEEMKSKKECDRETVERFGNISSIERLLVQLEETERQFEDFWTMHLSRLKKCLELRRFEQEFRELQNNFDRHLKVVSDMTEIGETVTRMDQLLQETKEFQVICSVDVERAEQVINVGQRLIGSRGCISSCPKEVVQPKCDELNRVCELIHNRLSKRIDTLAKARELMERVEKANKWCTRGIELLATQRIEKCSVSAEIAEQSLQEIQDYLASAAEFKLSSPNEIKNEIQENTTLETKALVSQIILPGICIYHLWII